MEIVTILGAIALGIVSIIWMLPLILAIVLKHPNRVSISILTIGTGFTGIGWVICLAMVFWKPYRCN